MLLSLVLLSERSSETSLEEKTHPAVRTGETVRASFVRVTGKGGMSLSPSFFPPLSFSGILFRYLALFFSLSFAFLPEMTSWVA
jgi:hypothetical protein